MYYLSTYDAPIGEISLLSDSKNLVGLWCETQDPVCLACEKIIEEEVEVLLQTKDWLRCYFAGEKPSAHELPLSATGTDFQRRIWKMLSEIPYGETVTYGELARRVARDLGKPKMSAQAVGGAVGRNPLPIIVPCHRVVGTNGKLVGYTGGLDLKTWLLKHEGAIS